MAAAALLTCASSGCTWRLWTAQYSQEDRPAYLGLLPWVERTVFRVLLKDLPLPSTTTQALAARRGSAAVCSRCAHVLTYSRTICLLLTQCAQDEWSAYHVTCISLIQTISSQGERRALAQGVPRHVKASHRRKARRCRRRRRAANHRRERWWQRERRRRRLQASRSRLCAACGDWRAGRRAGRRAGAGPLGR